MNPTDGNCRENYGVEFDLMSKVNVNGDDQHPLYKHLNGLDLKPKGSGDVGWNFEKFVIGKDGTPLARFGSQTAPDESIHKEASSEDLWHE